MSSERHNTPTVHPGTRDQILDAARAGILAVGWSKATLTDIARRAGVSRMTVYRAWPDTQSLFADLMTREWSLVLGRVLERGSHDDDARAQLIADVVATVRALRNNELLNRIIELDSELLLPYLLDRPGRSQELLADVLAGQIKKGQKDGSIRKGNATTLARSLLLATHGFTLSAHTMGNPATYDRELRTLLDGFLKP